MRKGSILAVATLLACGLALVQGCESKSSKATAPAEPKWKGPAYRLAFDDKAPKANPKGVSIPAVKFTANPEALETRVVLVVQFDVPGTGLKNHMIAPPTDIQGAEGALAADYMKSTSEGLSNYLLGYHKDGKVGISVALARSSLNPNAGDAEIEGKLISDWLPFQVELVKGKVK